MRAQAQAHAHGLPAARADELADRSRVARIMRGGRTLAGGQEGTGLGMGRSVYVDAGLLKRRRMCSPSYGRALSAPLVSSEGRMRSALRGSWVACT